MLARRELRVQLESTGARPHSQLRAQGNPLIDSRRHESPGPISSSSQGLLILEASVESQQYVKLTLCHEQKVAVFESRPPCFLNRPAVVLV